MAKGLNCYVYVTREDGTVVAFGPGFEVPDWARKLITNPDVWEGDEDEDDEPQASPALIDPEPTPGPEDLVADPDNVNPEVTPEPTSDDPDAGRMTEPPRAGSGSSKDAWRAYAESEGIEVPEDASRDDIIKLVDER